MSWYEYMRICMVHKLLTTKMKRKKYKIVINKKDTTHRIVCFSVCEVFKPYLFLYSPLHYSYHIVLNLNRAFIHLSRSLRLCVHHFNCLLAVHCEVISVIVTQSK